MPPPLNSPPPPSFFRFVSFSRGIASLDVGSLLTFDCLFDDYDYHSAMRVKFIGFGLVNVVYCVPTLYLRHRSSGGSSRVKGQYSRAVYCWIGTNYLLYATMCYTVFRAL